MGGWDAKNMLAMPTSAPLFLFQAVMGPRDGAQQQGGEIFSEKRMYFFLDCGRPLSDTIFAAELLPKANQPPFPVMPDQGEGSRGYTKAAKKKEGGGTMDEACARSVARNKQRASGGVVNNPLATPLLQALLFTKKREAAPREAEMQRAERCSLSSGDGGCNDEEYFVLMKKTGVQHGNKCNINHEDSW
ncbi:MAG: hypothetical protein PF568_02215, partial [Deltaproteobacteria bacterium]|nr:hypothetical protein [Deltaproteobacteria bacterium]